MFTVCLIIDLTPLDQVVHIAMCAGYSLLYQRGLLKVDDFTAHIRPAGTDDSHKSWAERLFLVQVSKSPDALEATANVLLEVDAPLDVISWFKGIYMDMPIQTAFSCTCIPTYCTHAHTDLCIP